MSEGIVHGILSLHYGNCKHENRELKKENDWLRTDIEYYKGRTHELQAQYDFKTHQLEEEIKKYKCLYEQLLQENKYLRTAQPIKRKVGRPKKENPTTINYVCCKPEIESND
jgi:hypothetical protein